MKPIALLLLSLFALSAFADDPAPSRPARSFLLGTWRGAHPHWNSTVEFRADGSFLRADGQRGHWTLSADGDHPLLVLRWDIWGTESLDWVSENRFTGSTRFGPFDLVREPDPAPGKVEAAADGPEFHTWNQGDPPLKLIRKDEGYCALTTVSGGFAGGGEAVWVSVGEDGYWYLGGRSQQEGVSATCIVIRYSSPAKPVAAKEPLTGAWYASGDPDRKCEIRSEGNRLAAKNELGDATRLHQEAGKIFADDWPGSITGVQTGNAILWSNETYWTKTPLR
jgi:hypothetical protein